MIIWYCHIIDLLDYFVCSLCSTRGMILVLVVLSTCSWPHLSLLVLSVRRQSFQQTHFHKSQHLFSKQLSVHWLHAKQLQISIWDYWSLTIWSPYWGRSALVLPCVVVAFVQCAAVVTQQRSVCKNRSVRLDTVVSSRAFVWFLSPSHIWHCIKAQRSTFSFPTLSRSSLLSRANSEFILSLTFIPHLCLCEVYLV